ncbi:MAG: hypothetical protein AB7N80_10900 [Bdellovibrionales bacterium]
MTDLMREFQAESLGLVEQMLELLETCESGSGEPIQLEKFGQYADRIMGASRQLLTQREGDALVLGVVAQLAELCKVLGYKTAQLAAEHGLWPVAVGVLLDANEELRRLIVEVSGASSKTNVAQALLERLNWLNQQFSASIGGGVPMSQVEQMIDQLKGMKKPQ